MPEHSSLLAFAILELYQVVRVITRDSLYLSNPQDHLPTVLVTAAFTSIFSSPFSVKLLPYVAETAGSDATEKPFRYNYLLVKIISHD
jgi:hypothetical protein